MIEEPIVRTWNNCYFHSKATNNNCGILRDEYACQPLVCKWHRTKEEYLESLYKASCNYEKATGSRDYQVKFVPMVLRDEFIEYRKKREREIMTDE